VDFKFTLVDGKYHDVTAPRSPLRSRPRPASATA
jgi:hypothetical protein